jgi:hypothetical protein
MAWHSLTDEQLLERVRLYREHGSANKAAQAIGLNRRVMDRSLRIAAERGLMGTDPVLPGFRIAVVKSVTNADGNTIRTTVEQREARGAQHQVPPGHIIKGKSMLVDGEGRTIVEWVKTRAGDIDPEEQARIFEEAFADFKPSAAPATPPDGDDDTLVVYPLADWHLGMYAWSKETLGSDWDLTIANQTIRAAMFEAINRAPPAAHALVLGIGDLLHADSAKNLTPDSGNIMDVDTRYEKCLRSLATLITDITDRIRNKHTNVRLVLKEGNHDRSSTAGLRIAAHMFYRNTPGIVIDTDPSPFSFHHFGCNLLGATHGDGAKLADLPLIMARLQPEAWAASTTRHWHTGHIHHDSEKEIQGVACYSHRAPIPPDAWHTRQGYVSGRSVKAIIYHRTRGYRGRVVVEM